MKIKVKKLFCGHLSVRDYIVQKCIDKKEDLVINFNNRIMTVSLEILKQSKSKFCQFAFNSQYRENFKYKLIDFPFIADDTKIEIKDV